jgi:ATP-dependent 26S proteasome regulatory subunit
LCSVNERRKIEEGIQHISILGTTNRLDMIEPALLRRGRFDLQIKIG